MTDRSCPLGRKALLYCSYLAIFLGSSRENREHDLFSTSTSVRVWDSVALFPLCYYITACCSLCCQDQKSEEGNLHPIIITSPSGVACGGGGSLKMPPGSSLKVGPKWISRSVLFKHKIELRNPLKMLGGKSLQTMKEASQNTPWEVF